MEETWELAVVSDGDNTPFTDGGVKFIQMNEFAVRYHLVQVENHIEEFHSTYNDLHRLSKLGEDQIPEGVDVWDLVSRCAEALTGIANVLDPQVRGSKESELYKFTKFRAEAVSGLLGVHLDYRSSLVDLRNRFHHEDEDFDEWYFNSMAKGIAPSKITRRKLMWDESPLCLDNEAVASGYDLSSGFVHFFDKRFSLHDFMSWVKELKGLVADAHEELTNISGSRTEVTTL